MSLQFDTAFRILSDYFGFPKWDENPKSGQSRKEIVKVWEEELRFYSPEQVKVACYEVCRYAKSMTFPTISHIMAQLVDKEKLGEKPRDEDFGKAEQGTSPELQLWELTGKHYIYGAVKRAFQKMVVDFKAVYPELASADSTLLYANMRKNGYWDNRIGFYVEK